MTGTELIKAERAIYYAALNTLVGSDIPRELWPLVMDSAAGRIKDECITALAVREDKEADDGEHPAGD